MALECDDWPAAENIHVISSATQADAERWLEGLEADGLITGWPYGKHAAGPEAGRVPGLYGVLGLILPARGPAATPVWRPGGRVPACPLNSGPGIQDRPRQWRDVFPGQQPQPDQQGVGMSGRDAERLAADGVHARPSQARHQILRAPPPADRQPQAPARRRRRPQRLQLRAGDGLPQCARMLRLPRLDRDDGAVLQPMPRQLDEQRRASQPHDMARLSRTRRFGSGATR